MKPFIPLNKQSGIALIVSLLFLLLLTIIGITAIQTTTLQEHMAGNYHDRDLAFQAAEAALRAGENDVSNRVFDTSKTGYYPVDNTDYTQLPTPAPRWQRASTHWLSYITLCDNSSALATDSSLPCKFYSSDKTTTLASLANAPQYIVEELPPVLDPATDEPIPHTAYQITSRSAGSSGNAQVVLQSVFLW